jgi:hypothetical protein
MRNNVKRGNRQSGKGREGLGEEQREEREWASSEGKEGNRRGAEGRDLINEVDREEREYASIAKGREGID